MASFPERVATKAADVDIAKLLLTLLALPFYVLGLAVGLTWVALRWIYAAVVVGFADVAERRTVTDDAG